jgi:hypothetical protein
LICSTSERAFAWGDVQHVSSDELIYHSMGTAGLIFCWPGDQDTSDGQHEVSGRLPDVQLMARCQMVFKSLQ